MRRILLLPVGAIAALALLVLTPALAAAQPTFEEIADALQRDGLYVEVGADADADELASALDGIDEVVVVVLAEDESTGADELSEALRDLTGLDASVLVITPGEVAVSSASSRYSDAELDAALDASLDAFDAGASTTGAVVAFTDELKLTPTAAAPTPVAASSGTGDSGTTSGGGGGLGGFLIFFLVIAAIIGGLFWWSKRRANKIDTAEVDRAKSEIRAQLEQVAHDIVEHEHTIDLADNEQAVDHYRDASATYKRVAEEVEQTENLHDLAEMNDDVDIARWQLEAALALAEGRDVPPRPEPDKPAACFFDPTHKPGTEECTIKTSAGDKEVRVCRSCAAKLEKGERPEPRMIDVGGKRVPAAKAPKSHGGLGMGGLSIFEVILGGLGALAAGRSSRPSRTSRSSGTAGVGLDWGDMLPKRRKSGTTFGPDRQAPRPVGLPRTTRSSPRSRTRTRLPSRSSSRSRSVSRNRSSARSRTRSRRR